MQPLARHNRTARGFQVVGRLRDDVSVAAAQQDLSAIAARLKQLHGDGANMVDASVRPVMEQLAGNVRAALTVLLGASGVLLLVACVNVANLMLARALARDRESALRLALGAGRARVARRFMAESLVLTAAGAGLGLVIAFGGVAALLAQDTAAVAADGRDRRGLARARIFAGRFAARGLGRRRGSGVPGSEARPARSLGR